MKIACSPSGWLCLPVVTGHSTIRFIFPRCEGNKTQLHAHGITRPKQAASAGQARGACTPSSISLSTSPPVQEEEKKNWKVSGSTVHSRLQA